MSDNGSRLKREIMRRASEQSERIYAAMVKQKQSADNSVESFQHEDLLFDPTRPVQTDWERVLAKIAEKLIAGKKAKA